MSLGIARRKELQKRRSKNIWFFLKLITFVGGAIGIFYYAMNMGAAYYNEQNQNLEEDLAHQTQQLDKLQKELGETRANLEQIEYLVPNQEVREFLVLINRQLEREIKIERMSQLISGLSNDQNCQDRITSKTFTMSTPVYKPAKATISLRKGIITLRGYGSPSLDPQGNPESRYDPAKPVSLTFTLPGGVLQKKTGLLPLYHSAIVKNKEYRLTISDDKGGDANVVMRICDVPKPEPELELKTENDLKTDP